MADASLFVRKRKDKQRQRFAISSRSDSAPPPVAGPSTSRNGFSSPRPTPPLQAEGSITEYKLVSYGVSEGLRHNVMKLNSARSLDPTQISRPILMNRKQPGPRAPPSFQFDDHGKIIGRYVYDDSGKAVIGADGKPTVEKKSEMDMTLVGTAPGQGGRQKGKKGVKEVFHQDIEVIRLRREENTPWILESGQPKDKANLPEHWVGRMTEPSAMPTVLLINDGRTDGFSVATLGRTYRFEPERPFKVLDPDAAHKLFEHQAKYKIHDRWAQREAGPVTKVTGLSEPRMKRESRVQVKQEERATRMEQKMRAARPSTRRRIKVEKFDDDTRREGRQLERGLEGGVDEELDYDAAEDFQDDEENNTFYRNEEEEEDAKLQEEQLKKEFRLANANVGDKPQIEEDDLGEDDLFGEKLNSEGRKLRRMMRKRLNGQTNDLFGESDSDEESSDAETVKTNKDRDKDKDKSNDTDKDRNKDNIDSASAGHLRPVSRGASGRGVSSPTGRKVNSGLSSGKASTAPPGSGSALLAHRAASRGASPRPSRQTSPLNSRAISPDVGRAPSPVNSARGASPSGAARGTTPTSAREASPVSSTSAAPATSASKAGKRKTTSEPPLKEDASEFASQKRKPSPGTSTLDRDRKKKKSASTTPTPIATEPDIAPFPGMITQTDVLEWFRRQGGDGASVPMNSAILHFRDRITSAGSRRDDNQKLFLHWVGALTVNEPGKRLRLKDGL